MKVSFVVFVGCTLVCSLNASDLRQSLRARASSNTFDCGLTKKNMAGFSKFDKTNPFQYFYAISKTPPAGQAWYTLTSGSMSFGLLGTPCTFKKSVNPHQSIGGIQCEDQDVDISAPGGSVVLPGSSKPQCVPCMNRKIGQSPENSAALATCGIFSKVIGSWLDPTEDFFAGTGESIGKFFTGDFTDFFKSVGDTFSSGWGDFTGALSHLNPLSW